MAGERYRHIFLAGYAQTQGFTNPRRGEPDCRNRTLHKMFRLVGVGEQAGTGIPKILHGWRSQHWSLPKLYDTPEPYNQTLLELRMIDLFPEPVMAGLKSKFGARFDQLPYVERVALALAASEGTVNHSRLRAVTTEHPVDLSKTLQHLTQAGMLESTGGRGAVYHLPGEAIPTPEDVFGPPTRIAVASSPVLGSSLPNLEASSTLLEPSSPLLGPSSTLLKARSPDLGKKRDSNGCLIAGQLPLPIIDDLDALSPALRSRLEGIASEPRLKSKLDRKVLIAVVLQLCAKHFITLRCLAALVQRKPNALRDKYLLKLVRARTLTLAFPTTPTHERQAYCASSALSS